ncbi:DUF4276 family protein [Amycolatopsis sp. NPDC059021]|uniref:DUF4276 family protein n=1 Tax=Amycolatopsis sp. NPDC059021 TaxID=3346704 RepID=UPI00366F9D7C
MAERQRLHLLVEGQTEATVVREVLLGYLQRLGWTVTWSVVRTQTTSATHRGGVSSWPRLHREIKELLGQKSLDLLTTLFDFYGFPEDAPGMNNRPGGSARGAVEHVEKAMDEAICDRRFLPHLVLHELETWVFAAADQLGELRGDETLAAQLRQDSADADGVELVNDGPKTAPSKRLARYCADYLKTVDGPLAIADLGIDRLKDRCPHFAAWLDEIERR